MKSLLQESSSVSSAIEKAWKAAGSPANFSVKIISEGESNFFGFTKTPAIVSLTYGPQGGDSSKSGRRQSKRFSGKDFGGKESVSEKSSERSERSERHERKEKNHSAKSKESGAPTSQETWDQEDVDCIVENMNYFLDSMESVVKFESQIEGNVLRLKFAEPLIGEASVERSFAASLSLLSMQILRKKTKKPLRGIKLLLDVPKGS